ncbi:hypothetical protein ACSBR1_015347 [Camellia fascicularis]
MDKEEDDANKVDCSDDLEAQGDVAKNQWDDMEGMGEHMVATIMISLFQLLMKRLENWQNQSAAAGFLRPKSSMQSRLL